MPLRCSWLRTLHQGELCRRDSGQHEQGRYHQRLDLLRLQAHCSQCHPVQEPDHRASVSFVFHLNCSVLVGLLDEVASAWIRKRLLLNHSPPRMLVKGYQQVAEASWACFFCAAVGRTPCLPQRIRLVVVLSPLCSDDRVFPLVCSPYSAATVDAQ